MLQTATLLTIVLISIWTLPSVLGLKCQTCIYFGGVTGEEKCKHGDLLSDSTLRPCSSYSSALNAREIEAARFTTPGAKFKLACLKTIVKADDVDIVIRACYGQDLGKGTVSENVCESPKPNFWEQLREGPLAKWKEPLDISKAELKVCVCNLRDGCNAGSDLNYNIFLIILSVVNFIFTTIN